jgi:site-specific DNA-methyltransferase (adenine-specific)
MDLMKEYPDKYFNLAITDPPYFTGPEKSNYYGAKFNKQKKVERKQYKKLDNWNIPGQKYYDELCRISNNQIIWGINYFSFVGIGSGRIIWDKQKAYNLSFSDGEIAYCSLINSVRFFRYTWDGMIQGNMKNKEIKIHPTQKPVTLYKWLLANFANKGDKIIDTHLGSGSIAIACNEMKYNLIASEIDEYYFNAACKRIELAAAQQIFDFGALDEITPPHC